MLSVLNGKYIPNSFVIANILRLLLVIKRNGLNNKLFSRKNWCNYSFHRDKEVKFFKNLRK